MRVDKLPLFILGPDFFPGFNGSLRVFEPRYKQMMDDCIMDSKPFGYISADPNKGELNGWSQPSEYGTLCYVSDYEESGTNLIIRIESSSVFHIEEVILPVLSRSDETERFPGIEELMSAAGNPEGGKLYFTANVRILDPPSIDYDDEVFSKFIENIQPVKHLLQLSSMYKNQVLDFNESNLVDVKERSVFIWKICCSLCYDVNIQQNLLSQDSFSKLIQSCENHISKIVSRSENNSFR